MRGSYCCVDENSCLLAYVVARNEVRILRFVIRDDGFSNFLRNVRNALPFDTASYPRKPESSQGTHFKYHIIIMSYEADS